MARKLPKESWPSKVYFMLDRAGEALEKSKIGDANGTPGEGGDRVKGEDVLRLHDERVNGGQGEISAYHR